MIILSIEIFFMVFDSRNFIEMYSLQKLSPYAPQYQNAPIDTTYSLLFIGVILHWLYLLELICVQNPALLWNIVDIQN